VCPVFPIALTYSWPHLETHLFGNDDRNANRSNFLSRRPKSPSLSSSAIWNDYGENLIPLGVDACRLHADDHQGCGLGRNRYPNLLREGATESQMKSRFTCLFTKATNWVTWQTPSLNYVHRTSQKRILFPLINRTTSGAITVGADTFSY
jgi:hypothetical protein